MTKSIFFSCFLILFFACKKDPSNFCKHNGPQFDGDFLSDSIKIFIPTGFTPNSDGVNDVYYFVTKSIKTFDIKISKGLSTYFEIVGSDSTWYWDGSNSKGKIKEGEYDVEATLYTYSGKEIKVETKVAIAQDYFDLPCWCSRADQIHPDDGFVGNMAESCND